MQREITSRAVILISGFVLCFGWCRAAADVFADKAQIESLIESGKLADAQQKIEKLKADYAQDSQLPCALFWIGRKFEWSNRYDQAKDIYQQIIQNHPDDSYAPRARIGLPRIEVLTLVASKRFDQAQAALDKLLADFAGNPDLPGSLYWIAERYRWAEKDEKAKHLYQQIIQNYPDNAYALKARLALARQEVLSLIGSWNYGPAQKVLDKLVADFAGNPDLPEALYWIAREYGFTGAYQEAKNVFEQIAKEYPASTFADKARLGTAATEVCLLIVSDQIEASQTALEKLKNDFAAHPDLGEVLHEVAKAYDYQDSLKEARDLHSAVAAAYPDKEYGSLSAIDQAKVAIIELIDANNFTAAHTAIAEMRRDFANHPQLPDCLVSVAERCQERDETTLAAGLYQDVMDGYGDSAAAPLVCERLVHYYVEQKAYQDALSYALRLYEDWPDSEHAWYGLFTIGELNERMKASGLLGDEVDGLIQTCYQNVVMNYPDCFKAKYAAFRLAESALKKEDWTDVVKYNSFLLTKFEAGEEPAAVLYPLALGYDKLGRAEDALETYKLFIIKANTTDPRKNGVLQRITELESAPNNNAVSFIILPDAILSNVYGGCSGHFTCKKDLELSEYPCSTDYPQTPCSSRTTSVDCTFVGCNCKKEQKRCQEPWVNCNQHDCIDSVALQCGSVTCTMTGCKWETDPENPGSNTCQIRGPISQIECTNGSYVTCYLMSK